MKEPASDDPAQVTDINRPIAIIAAILVAVVGPEVFIVQPGFVQGLVKYLGFTEQQAGYIASAEMWGIALSTVAMAFVAETFSWRKVLWASTLVVFAGNIASVFVTGGTAFAALRFITGVGSGGLISLSFTIIGLTANPDRNFGFLIMAVLIYGALGLLAMPSAYTAIGMQGVILFFAFFALTVLPFIRYLPVSGSAHAQVEDDATDLPGVYRAMAVATMLCYFIAQGVVWAYLFLMGVNGGIGEQEVANGLTLSQFLGIAGAFVAVVLGRRFGRIGPISVGIAGGIVPLMFLFGHMGAMVYAVAVCVYNFAWNMTHPYLLAAMASFDRTGRVVVHAVAAQMIGLAIGPAIAASVISGSDYGPVNWLGMAFFAAAAVLIIPPIYKHTALLPATARVAPNAD